MARFELPHNWVPRRYQRKLWVAWEQGVKRDLSIWHRRAGKDEIFMHRVAVAANPEPHCPYPNMRVANYWHALPMYAQARKAIWEAVNPRSGRRRIDEAFPREIRERVNEHEMSITFKSGSTYRIVGSDNPDSLVGAAPFGVGFSEWALSNPGSWALIEPILIENDGWASFFTTPRGRNHAHAMYEAAKGNPRWHVELLTVDDTVDIMPRDAIEDARHTYARMFGKEAADALIQQEYWCSFEAAILGAYYGKEMARAEREGRITKVMAWPDVPLNTAWDLGASRRSDTMSIWPFQVVPHESGESQILVLGHITGAGMSIAHYAQEIRNFREVLQMETRANGWPDCHIPAGDDFVPHDARVPEMTSSGLDGKAKLRIEVMREHRLRPRVVTQHREMDGVSAVRQVFHRLWFDRERCDAHRGLEALIQFRAEWDEDMLKFKDAPLADWTKHHADALRYLAIALRDPTVLFPTPQGRRLAVEAGGGVNEVTLNDLWALSRRSSRRI